MALRYEWNGTCTLVSGHLSTGYEFAGQPELTLTF